MVNQAALGNHRGLMALLNSPEYKKGMFHINSDKHHWQDVYHHIKVIFYTFYKYIVEKQFYLP